MENVSVWYLSVRVGRYHKSNECVMRINECDFLYKPKVREYHADRGNIKLATPAVQLLF